ncbi:transcriptional regulator [Intestinimonas butyriciproducens]|jgi:hypothetical protein|uniref:transcriptional regulator n=1 Tax=Intestinimonas butyriciproducens TaxID=1297617 RepID=UPI001AB033FC|nr:transcriptional regulator [Intestinimonas butyriciproducens]MBO3280974.1 transcriptional regulator [Intestinimonas butyriciproducens]
MIFVEDGTIKLNGVVLPGLVKNIEVKESARIDEQEVEGSPTKPKQATGYEDAKVNIELVVDDTETQTKYQRLETLRDIFRKAGQSVPQPIPIVCEDTAAHGIDKVLFKSLNHKAENKKGYFSVTLELWEYIPQTIRATKSSSGSASSSSTKKSGSTSGSLKPDYKSYLDSGRGSPPTASGSIGGYTNVTKSKKALTNKKNGSPAVDDADTSKVRSKLKSRQRST